MANLGDSSTSRATLFRDDQSLLAELVRGETLSEQSLLDIASRLSLDLDHEKEDAFWKSLCSDLGQRGFSLQPDSLQRLPSSDSAVTLPPALETEAGMLHLKATAALLNISEARAAQTTLGAFSSLATDATSNLTLLLGTREFLLKTLHHHQRERMARLCFLTELIRLEQDQSYGQRDVISSILDAMDALYSNGGCKMGLFRRLLYLTGSGIPQLTRSQMEPCKQLQASSPASLETAASLSGSNDWNMFVEACRKSFADQAVNEMNEALEGLLVLLYSRVSVTRSVYACLLLYVCPRDAMSTSGSSMHLRGLILAEGATLCRAVEDGSQWVSEHPLLEGILRGQAEVELEALRTLLLEVSAKALEKGASSVSQVVCPESLALLSMGLLFKVAYVSLLIADPGASSHVFWRKFDAIGVDMVQTANDTYGAFDYLQLVMEELASVPVASLSAASDSEIFDWDYKSDASMTLASTIGTATGQTMAYTTIGKEILDAAIFAFEDTLLNVRHPSAGQNMGVLSHLASAVYMKSPVLSETFWEEWSLYTGSPGGTQSGRSAMCKLMDATHSLAVKTLRDAQDNGGANEEVFCSSVAPLLQLVAALCTSDACARMLFDVLPQGLIQNTVALCKPESMHTTTELYKNARKTILRSLSILCSFSEKAETLDSLRVAFGFNNGPVQGARILTDVIVDLSDKEILRDVLSIFARLLFKAPQNQALILAGVFNSERGLAKIFESSGVHLQEAGQLLLRFLDHLPLLLFDDSLQISMTIDYLIFVANTTLTAGMSLAKFSSTTWEISFDAAGCILEAQSSLLDSLRIASNMHPNDAIRAQAEKTQDNMLHFLAGDTRFGESLAFIASAPVALTLVLRVDELSVTTGLLREVSSADRSNGDSSTATKYADWTSVAKGNLFSMPLDLNSQLRVNLRNLLVSIHMMPIDIDRIHAMKLTSGSASPFSCITAARRALELLNRWACIVDERSSGTTDIQAESSDTSKIVAFSPYRLMTSLVSLPSSLYSSSEVASAWATAGPSMVEVLLRYAFVDKENSPHGSHENMPCCLALDLLNTCVTHSSFFDGASKSALFDTLLVSSVVPEMFSFPTKKVESGASTRDLLAMRLLGTLISASDTLTKSIFEKNAKLITAVGNLFYRVECLLDSSRGNYDDAIVDGKESIYDLQMGTAALWVVFALWKRARQDGAGISSCRSLITGIFVPENEKFLRRLFRMLVDHAGSLKLPEARTFTSKESQWRSCILSLFSSALSILTLEMGYARSNHDSSFGDFRPELEGAFSTEREKILLMAEVFVTFGATPCYLSSDFSFAWTTLASIPTIRVSSSFFLSDDPCRYDVGVSTFMASRWLQCLSVQGGEAFDVDGMASSIAVGRKMMHEESALVSAWKEFVEVMPQFSPKAAESDALETLGHVTLRRLCSNLEELDMVCNHDSFASSRDVVLHMTTNVCGIVLFCTHEALEAHGPPSRVSDVKYLLGTLNLLFRSSVALEGVIEGKFIPSSEASIDRVYIYLAVMEQLVGCLVLCARDINRQSEFLDETTLVDLSVAYREMASMLCRSLHFVRSSRALPTRTDQFVEACSLCISLLLGVPKISRVSERYLDQIADVFESHGTIQTLVWLVKAREEHDENNESAFLPSSVLRLLGTTIGTGNMKLVNQIADSDIEGIVCKKAMSPIHKTAAGDADPTQRHLSSSGERPILLGPHPTHWVQSMKIVEACLRTATGIDYTGKVQRFVLQMAVDFLVANHAPILDCMRGCLGTVALSASRLKVVTAILSLLAEACIPPWRDMLARLHPDLIQTFVSDASKLLVKISKLMAAAGTSRELFRTLDDYENSGGLSIGQLGDLNPLAATGIQNLRHEAFRYSHFGFRLLSTTTKQEYKASSEVSPLIGNYISVSSSFGDLESNCRRSVCSTLMIDVEQDAAKCASKAVLLIYRAHPALSCFVLFSQEEALKLDNVNFVDDETLIAFRNPQSGAMEFGRVVGRDTIDRCWYVQDEMSGDDVSPKRVTLDCLAGVEDKGKRNPVAEYCPAPESAEQLEGQGPSLTVGTLVLMLRWCQQNYDGVHGKKDKQLIRSLAEQTCCLLGTDIAIHNEIGSPGAMRGEDRAALEMQLLDLFGSPSQPVAGRYKVGKFKAVVDEVVWKGVAGQLQNEVNRATVELENRERKAKESRKMSLDQSGGRMATGNSRAAPANLRW